MMKATLLFQVKWMICMMILMGLTACNTLSQLASVGETPKLSPVENPTHNPDYKPVSMPMPVPIVASPSSNSLWRSGSRAFFKDLRASQIGDIVTVIINIDDQADMSNSSSTTRNSDRNMGIGGLFGYEQNLDKVLPEGVNNNDLLGLQSDSNQSGSGVISRDEQIDLRVAAVVTQILPNGNLVIQGRQETIVNYETRELQVAGVIRPQDISNNNTINYDQIAEARLAYGGKGHISNMQAPKWGSQIVDVLLPF